MQYRYLAMVVTEVPNAHKFKACFSYPER